MTTISFTEFISDHYEWVCQDENSTIIHMAIQFDKESTLYGFNVGAVYISFQVISAVKLQEISSFGAR